MLINPASDMEFYPLLLPSNLYIFVFVSSSLFAEDIILINRGRIDVKFVGKEDKLPMIFDRFVSVFEAVILPLIFCLLSKDA